MAAPGRWAIRAPDGATARGTGPARRRSHAHERSRSGSGICDRGSARAQAERGARYSQAVGHSQAPSHSLTMVPVAKKVAIWRQEAACSRVT